MITKIAGKTVSVIRRTRTAIVAVSSVVLVNYAHAVGTVPVDIDQAADDGFATFTKAKGYVLTVVLFGIALGYLGMLRRKR